MVERYGVIVCDAAWRYRNAQNGAADGEYASTMSLAEITALPVDRLAAADAALFFWTTWPFLEASFAILKAWRFEYVTGLPWIKVDGEPSRDLWGELFVPPLHYGVGYWLRGVSEPLLIAKRGAVSGVRTNLCGLLSDFFGHSRKPENVYHIAEQLPGPYLELFARRRRPGWDAWGNEVDGSIDLGVASATSDGSMHDGV